MLMSFISSAGCTVAPGAYSKLKPHEMLKLMKDIHIPMWQADCLRANVSAGSAHMVSGSGRGHAEVVMFPLGPFLG